MTTGSPNVKLAPFTQRTDAEKRAFWFKQANESAIVINDLKGLIFALDAVADANPAFDAKPQGTCAHIEQHRHALRAMINQLCDFAADLESTGNARFKFDAWQSAEADFSAALAAVEAKHQSKPSDAYEADLAAVQDRHAAPIAEALQALIDAPATTPEALALKVRASLERHSGSENCPLIASIATQFGA